MSDQLDGALTAVGSEDALEFRSVTLEALYPGELKRWLLIAGLPMLIACVCVALAFGTPFPWFYAGAIAFGPGLGVLAIIYLAITSDTNGSVMPAGALASSTRTHDAVPNVAAA